MLIDRGALRAPTPIAAALEDARLQNDEYFEIYVEDNECIAPEEIEYYTLPLVAVDVLIRLYFSDRDVREYVDLETAECMAHVQAMLAPEAIAS